MRVIVVSQDQEAAEWLANVLLTSGLSVLVMPTPDPGSPDLGLSQLLIADRASAEALGDVGPSRRMLLVPRGQAVDLATAMGGGFLDLLIVPSPEEDILARVGRALDELLSPASSKQPHSGQLREFKEVVDRVVAALRSAPSEQREQAHRLTEGMLSVFSLLIDSHETTGRGTPGHSRRTGAVVAEVTSKLGLPAHQAGWLELAGRLHDLGMVVLDLPLADEAPLGLELRSALVGHPRISAEILAPLAAWGLPVDAIAAHHERPDGSGYPRGLSGDEVTLEAQILGASDVFEALVSPRPWRPAESPADAVDAISRMGFAPQVVDALGAVTSTEVHPPHKLAMPPESQ